MWSICAKLQLERRLRDLALFTLAIDSKLRGCDLIALRVSDVAPNGCALDRASVRQKKTGRPVRFKLTEQTRESVDEYLRSTGREPAQFTYFPAGADPAGISRRGSLRASLLAGSVGSASIHASLQRIPCVGPR